MSSSIRESAWMSECPEVYEPNLSGVDGTVSPEEAVLLEQKYWQIVEAIGVRCAEVAENLYLLGVDPTTGHYMWPDDDSGIA